MILIYTEEINNRLQYICNLIFTELLGIKTDFTTSRKTFIESQLPKLNYSYEKFNDELYIKPHRLLFLKAFINPSIQPVRYNGERYFCESSADSDLPFDPLAASFFLVSRYEEYFEEAKDARNRYPAEKSILYKYNLLNKPVVNIWANLLGEKIKEKYPSIKIKQHQFRYLCTVDIDNAYAYKHKSFIRQIAASLKALFTGNISQIKERFEVAFNKKKDPFDTYDYLDSVFKGNEKNVRFFALLGDYGTYDKNISYKNRHYKDILNHLSQKYTLGLHPSYQSSKKKQPQKVEEEAKRFQSMTGKYPEGSRQHFLRLFFPRSYRRLLKAGIKKDYTMGYPSLPGFRAGICTPYYFYDLKKEEQTALKIIPFQIMDGTLRNYMHLSPEKAIETTNELMAEVKKIGGLFVSIWHNETVNDCGRWKGYQKVFEKMNEQGFKWTNEQN